LVFPNIVNTFASNLNNLAMDELNRLKVVLVEQKKTGKWLAEQLGVSVTTTSRWCSNAAQPDLQTLNKIAQLLNVSIHDLIKQQ
jgi:transcriptional regulator with XRE-family HTH domain